MIVVGLDGSPASWDAFCRAAGHAARARGSLIAVYVTSTVAEAGQRAAEVGVQLTFVRELGDTVHALTTVARSETLTCWSSAGRPRCRITRPAQRAADWPPVGMRQ